MKKKGFLELDFMGWIILTVIAFAIATAAIFILSGQGRSVIERITEIFNFRG